MTSTNLDQPTTPRPGEELDSAKLQTYLNQHLPGYSGDLTIQQFPGGHSNLTYMLRLGQRDLVLRRPPFGARIKSAHDMGREPRILSHLVEVYRRVPRPLLYCQDESILGAPFYVMHRINGVILRSQPPKDIDLSPEVMRRLSTAFIDNLAAIHAVDYQAAGLADLGKPAGYVQRQITGWTKRYQHAQTDHIPAIDKTAAWLAANIPPETAPALIHNDYKYDNLILDPKDLANILAVLDWEMATIGDPLMDLGTTLAYWVEAADPPELQALAFGPTTLPGNLTRAELAHRYTEISGLDLPDMLFYYVYALFKLAVIVQQIYARYKSGHSQDARFASMIDIVAVMGRTAQRALDLGRIDSF
jgi:aminoglycoside phosphotransferase (APT) family kinase protein